MPTSNRSIIDWQKLAIASMMYWLLYADADTSCWRVETSGYYRDKECTLADFSEDGSVLAVVFENTLTFWDPIENQLCTSIDQGAKITALQFCHGAQANCVLVATEANITIWDLLNYTGGSDFYNCWIGLFTAVAYNTVYLARPLIGIQLAHMASSLANKRLYCSYKIVQRVAFIVNIH